MLQTSKFLKLFFMLHQNSRLFMDVDIEGPFPHVPISKQNLVILDFKENKREWGEEGTKIYQAN